MPKMKIHRKSTSIDMTAMCDVAFLLLSFFIFTAKFKKSEEVAIVTPNSVSTDNIVVKNKFNVYCNISDKGKVLMAMENDTAMGELGAILNANNNLQLSPQELDAFSKKTSLGMPFVDIKTYLSNVNKGVTVPEQDGIPVEDTAKNELGAWIVAAGTLQAKPQYADKELNVFIKADKKTPYEVVDKVLETFVKNSRTRFKLITMPEDIPSGTALYEDKKAGKLVSEN
jgi:biopolymer transport protein ExbD